MTASKNIKLAFKAIDAHNKELQDSKDESLNNTFKRVDNTFIKVDLFRLKRNIDYLYSRLNSGNDYTEEEEEVRLMAIKLLNELPDNTKEFKIGKTLPKNFQ